MKIAVLAPIGNSYYSRLVTFLLDQERDIQLTQIVVRSPWTLTRLRTEIRRDGSRLLKKAFRKLVLGEAAYDPDEETIVSLATELELPGKSLFQLGSELEVPVLNVDDHNSERALVEMAKSQPDLIVFTGGGLIRKKLLEIPTQGIINCHMGPLPPYRGMDVVEWPILEHGPESATLGLTTHLMDSGVDTGPILRTKAIPFNDCNSFRKLRNRFEREMVHMMVDTVKDFVRGDLKPKPQEAGAGKQYYLMHPKLYQITEQRLRKFAHHSSK